MSVPTAPQLAIMRRPNQSTELYLAVYQPPVVEHGRVFPDARIQGLPSELADNFYIAGFTATNVFTSGTVKNGMTLVFGSADGKEDLGRTFIRGHSGNHYDFSVLENMPLVSGIYYRVYDFFELWPVFPRVTVDSNNVITYYKDYDKTYNNQNSVFTPVAVVGPNYANFVDVSTGQKTVQLVATGSYTIDGTAISNVYWEINTSPATIITGSIASYTFLRSGNYTVETRVVNANGITGTAHRHYILLNRQGFVRTPYNPPFADWKFENLDGDWDSGTWQCKFSVGDDSDDIRDGALIVIFAEDVYGNGAPQSFGGYYDREHILFSGYIDKIEDRNDWQASRATYSSKSAIGLLQNRDMFSVSLETSPNPVDWTQLKDMTINKIIDHYLRWHSTFLDVCDYRPCKNTTSGDYPEQFEDIPRGEIFSNVRNILSNRLLANFVSDRQGRVFSEVNLNYTVTGTRPNTALTFQVGDWIDRLKTIESLEYSTSSILMGGVGYDQALNTGSAYLSRAPDALFPLHFGKAETKSGLTIDSQTTLNNLTGLYLAGNNSRFPSLGMTLSNNMRTIDVVPQEFYQLPTDYPFNDQDLRNLKYIWENRRMLPRRISYSLKEGTLQSEIIFETETSGPAGESVFIPTQPPTNGTPVPPDVPGVPNTPPTPGLGDLIWEVNGDTHLPLDVFTYGDFVYICGTSFRVEKRRKSDGGLEWTYTLASGTSAYGIYVDSDGIFVCGGSNTGGDQLFTFVELTDVPGVQWEKRLTSPGGDSMARGITKIGSHLYLAGVYAVTASTQAILKKVLASDGSSVLQNLNDLTDWDMDTDGVELYIAGVNNATNYDVSLSNHWTKSHVLGLGYSIKTDSTYSYIFTADTVSNTITVQKRQNNDGSLVWSSDLSIGPIGTIVGANMDTGNSYTHIPLGIDGNAKIYQLKSSNGSSFSEVNTIDYPTALKLDGLDMYIVGQNASNVWTVQKRTLAFT